MTDLIRPTRARPDAPSRQVGLPARLLLVLGLLAGLFAMHGLGAEHDLAMAGAHGAAGGAEEMAGHQPAVAPDPAPAPASDPMTDMAQACVAVLTAAAALALLLVGPLRTLMSRRPDVRPPTQHVRTHALPPPRPPDLSVLCVLRT